MTKEVYKEGVGRGKEGGRERGGGVCCTLGIPCSLSVASVITARVPSLPTSSLVRS
jgi:hypothetical protein